MFITREKADRIMAESDITPGVRTCTFGLSVANVDIQLEPLNSCPTVHISGYIPIQDTSKLIDIVNGQNNIGVATLNISKKVKYRVYMICQIVCVNTEQCVTELLENEEELGKYDLLREAIDEVNTLGGIGSVFSPVVCVSRYEDWETISNKNHMHLSVVNKDDFKQSYLVFVKKLNNMSSSHCYEKCTVYITEE